MIKKKIDPRQIIKNLELSEYIELTQNPKYKCIDIRDSVYFSQGFLPNTYNISFSQGYDEDVVAHILDIWKDFDFVLVLSETLHKLLLKEIIKILRLKVKAIFRIEQWFQSNLPYNNILTLKLQKDFDKFQIKKYEEIVVLNIKQDYRQHLDYKFVVQNYDIYDILGEFKNIYQNLPKAQNIFIISQQQSLITLTISILKMQGLQNVINAINVKDYILELLKKNVVGINDDSDEYVPNIPEIERNIMEEVDEEDEYTDSDTDSDKDIYDKDNILAKLNDEQTFKIKKHGSQKKKKNVCSVRQNLLDGDMFQIFESQIRPSIKINENSIIELDESRMLKMQNSKQNTVTTNQSVIINNMNSSKKQINRNQNQLAPVQSSKTVLSVNTNQPSTYQQLQYLQYERERKKSSIKISIKDGTINNNNNNNNNVSQVSSIMEESIYTQQQSQFIQPLNNKDRAKTIMYYDQKQEDEQTIGTIGRGAYGTVKQIIDWQQKVFYAIKTFTGKNAQQSYITEKQTYNHLQKTFGESMESYGMLLTKYDDVTYSLYYSLGLCTLREFTEYRFKNNIKWSKKEIFYLFKKLVEFVLFMAKKSYFHGDLKPMNIVMSQNEKDQLQIRIIDFAGASQKWEFHEMITPLYFNYYKREGDFLIKHPQFKNTQDRLKNELYTVIRVMQDVFVNSIDSDELKSYFGLGRDTNNQANVFQTEERLDKVMNGIKNSKEYESFYQQKDFKTFFDFVQNKMMKEDYEIKELINFMSDKSIFPKDLNHIEENGDICRLIIQDKLKNHKEKIISQEQEDPMEQLFKLESYLETMCTLKEGVGERQSLFPLIRSFLNNSNQSIFIIYGDAGTGKSSFVLYLKDKLQEEGGCIHFKMSKIRTQDELLLNIDQIYKNIKQSQRLIFIVEGYEQFQNHIDISLAFRLTVFTKIKVVITTRIESLPEGQVTQIFRYNSFDYSPSSGSNKNLANLSKNRQEIRQKIMVAYISLFDEKQKIAFTQNFIKTVKEKQHYYNIKFFDTAEQYFQKFESYTAIKQLTQNPLFLRVILEVLPEIEDQIMKEYKKQQETMNQLQKRLFSQYNINSQFLRLWIIRKLKQQVDKTEDVEKAYKAITKSKKKKAIDIISELNSMIAQDIILNDNQYFSLDLIVRVCHEDMDIVNLMLKCSPIKQSDIQYTYIHRSFYEFYVARLYIIQLSNLIDYYNTYKQDIPLEMIEGLALNQKRLTLKHYPIIQMVISFFMHSQFQHLEILRERVFLHIMILSKVNSSVSICSTNAASLYNMIHFSFSGLNLSYCKLRGALLQNAIMEQCNLQNSDLRAVNFTNAILNKSNLNRSNLTGTNFGQFPLLFGHIGEVTCVDFGSSGKFIVSGGIDFTIRLWTVENGEEVRIFNGHKGVINSVIFSNDGRYIISGSDDWKVIVWQIQTGEQKFKFDNHRGRVLSVAISHDTQYIASGGSDRTVKVFNLKNGKLQMEFIQHTDSVLKVCFFPNNNFLASGSADCTIRIWDLIKNLQVKVLKGHQFPIHSVNITGDSKNIISGCKESIKIWNIAQSNQIQNIQAQHNSIKNVQISLDSKYIASCGDDKSIRVWDLETGNQLKQLEGHDASINYLSFSFDGNLICSGSQDSSIRCWKLDSYKLWAQHNGHSQSVLYVAYSQAGKYIATSSLDQTIKIWNSETSDEINRLEVTNLQKEIYNKLVFSHNGKYLMSNCHYSIWNLDQIGTQCTELQKDFLPSYDQDSLMLNICFTPNDQYVCGIVKNEVIVWDTNNGNIVHVLKGHQEVVQQVLTSGDNQYIVSGSYDKTIKIWYVKDGSLLKTLKCNGRVKQLVFSPSFNSLACGLLTGDVQLWDFKTLRQIKTYEGNMNAVTLLTFSPNGSLLGSCCQDNTIRVYEWKSTDKMPIKTCQELQGEISQLEFTPNQKYIITVNGNNIHLWEVYQEEHKLLTGHKSQINSISVSSNGKYIVSGSDDKSIRIWDIQKGILKKMIIQTQVFDCRNLTFEDTEGISQSNQNLLDQYLKNNYDPGITFKTTSVTNTGNKYEKQKIISMHESSDLALKKPQLRSMKSSAYK